MKNKRQAKLKTSKGKDNIIETLYEELDRKNRLIEKLREENVLLMKTALKSAEKLRGLEEKLKRN